ncbi:hypothetical protein [Acetobacter pasteurianus]|uniref:Uncharacterized protein n=1 Tax=Acetobacter pasteurianus NBRC 3188 TaxID=1226663 RepID=A0A401WYL6_ACEPA|nr:hypothetical protein [Acetobacter pasteurianus]GCD54384.1 hypothetical protein NBRC3188_3081 [Acetobacter pasteurianus NBRC 3188]
MTSGTWTGAASNSLWSNSNNWSDNTLPDVSYQSVTFNDGAKAVLDSDLAFGGYYINVNGDVSLSSNGHKINGVSGTGLIVSENASLKLENITLDLEYVSNKSNITLENSHISVTAGNNTNYFMGDITFSSDETSAGGSSITITDDGGAANMLGTISNFGKYDKITVYKDGSVNNISVVENNDGTYSLLETLPSTTVAILI